MPLADEHKRQASHNFAFAQATHASDLDWRATALFYCALHHVDAALDRRLGRQPRDHRDRRDAMRELARRHLLTQDVWVAYRTLEERSRAARYECAWRGNPAFTATALAALEQGELRRVIAGLP